MKINKSFLMEKGMSIIEYGKPTNLVTYIPTCATSKQKGPLRHLGLGTILWPSHGQSKRGKGEKVFFQGFNQNME